jgi:PAS domain S-box-containing protein
MNDVMSVQLAISRLHLRSLTTQAPSETVAMEALAELGTALAELEATNEELTRSTTALAEITSAREMEARRYRELFEQIPVACMITDTWGVIEEANHAAESLLNVPRGMLQGKPISVFVPAENRREFRERLRKRPDGDWEVQFQRRDRERVTVTLEVGPVVGGPGSEPRLCFVIQNVSPQRVAASNEKLLARETTLRIEAQATATRLRAFQTGLQQMTDDRRTAIPHRVGLLLDSLVPRIAQSVSCQFPGADTPAIEVGDMLKAGITVVADIHAPQRAPGKLTARRLTEFTSDDQAIIVCAANAISALLCAASNAHLNGAR